MRMDDHFSIIRAVHVCSIHKSTIKAIAVSCLITVFVSMSVGYGKGQLRQALENSVTVAMVCCLFIWIEAIMLKGAKRRLDTLIAKREMLEAHG